MSGDGSGARLLAHVRAMQRIDAGVRLLESAAAALAAGGACLAAARLSGVAASEPHAWLAGALAAACAGLAWSLEHRSSAARVVRRLDRAEGLGGALVTAVEVSPTARAPELASLLARRTAGQLAPRAGLRAMLPRSGLLFAAPLAALALIALAEKQARSQASALARARIEERLSALSAAAGRLAPDATPPEALAAALEAARAELAGDRGDPAALAALDRELIELSHGIAAFAPTGASPSEEAPPGARDPARFVTDPSVARGPAETAPLEPATPRTADARLEASAGAGSGAAGEIPAVSGMEAAHGDGTIPGRGATSGASPDPAGSSTEPLATAPAEFLEGAVGQGRWWPARHDQVVARWVELGGTRDREPAPAPTPSLPPRD